LCLFPLCGQITTGSANPVRSLSPPGRGGASGTRVQTIERAWDMNDEAAGGRIFFSSTGRSLVDEDEIVVLSVGVDIGSSTSDLVFSRIVLERLDSRYVVT